MARRTISQREALRLHKRVAELEAAERVRRNSWAHEYPGGVNFWTFTVEADAQAAVRTARRLGHAVVATLDGAQLRLFALRERT